MDYSRQQETYHATNILPALFIALGSALVVYGIYEASRQGRPRISARRKDWSPEWDQVPAEYDQQDTVPEDLEPVDREPGAAPPPVTTRLDLPREGLYGYRNPERRYGTRRTIGALEEVGQAWSQRHPGIEIGIGDISKRGGGTISGHQSHKKGVDVDIRPIRRDGAKRPVTYRDAAYSRELTQDLVDLLRSNSVVQVTHIFFNDPNVRHVQSWPNHDDHLHVRFKLLA